jgi:hypothetical protein
MGKFEKIFVFLALTYILVYSFFFFNTMSNPDNFEKIIPFHILGMILSLGFIVVIVRDIFKRKFKNENAKAIWAILVIAFWPSVFIYLPKYAFKPRNVIPEPGNNAKYIVAFCAIVIIFFGYVAYSFFSAMQGFHHQAPTLNDLAASGKNEDIRALIEDGAIGDAELNGNGNWTPLHSAVSNNRISTVKLLIDQGANINQQCECNGDTPLHAAAQNGYYGIVKVLIEAGADKTILNNKNKTAYDLATEGGFTDTAELLKM